MDKNSPRTVRGKLVDSWNTCLISASREEVAGTIKGKPESLHGQRPECALYPVGSNFVDRGGEIRVVLIQSHDKQVACTIKGYAFSEKVSGKHCYSGRRAEHLRR